MPGFQQILERSKASVVSPDSHIRVVIHKGSSMRFAFAKDAYRRYDEARLCAQLAAVLVSAFAAEERVRREALSAAVGDTVHPRAEWQLDARERQLRKHRAHIAVLGKSDDGRVRVKRTGEDGWAVRIASGTLKDLDAAEFLTRFQQALSAAVREHRIAVADARLKVFGSARHRRYVAPEPKTPKETPNGRPKR
ncbi:hypothetical protein LX16_2400 [Stackebrandtia albiflava]|uniref:Uncharacterized protein n=1 Tax=Stackebrandtia albiflava TaxID=406432 RepID=A0A562V1H7_9ACTN|nr:hypothetical protein [Stackebrandtia albiflava]TWJ11673.1 hypothetical protein LX16_2400 [Stackebrandtia albiflava]